MTLSTSLYISLLYAGLYRCCKEQGYSEVLNKTFMIYLMKSCFVTLERLSEI